MKRIVLFSIIFGLFFFGCNGNDNVDKFVVKTNEETNNDIATLGLVGTTVLSNNPNVATAEITETAKIKITSVSEGIAGITVSDDANRNATINISVSEIGSITIGNIVKYSSPEPYDGQIFHYSIDMTIPAYVEGEPVTTISTGTIKDRRQNNVNSDDPNVYIIVGSISNNKVTLSLPTTVDNSKLDNEKGPYVGIFGSWGIDGTSQRLDLMCFNGDYMGDSVVIYSAAAKEDLAHDGDTLNVDAGWNFFIHPFDDGTRYKVSSLDELYQKGFKWYLRPSN
jgi:hypothetical protein